jgi:hypothetical protein
MIADTMEGLEGELATNWMRSWSIAIWQCLAKTCDEEMKRLAARKKSFENKIRPEEIYSPACWRPGRIS